MLENDLAPRQSLNGEWRISIDGENRTLQVPGVWEVQGYPRDVDRAVYSREFSVPDEWKNRRVYLHFGAASYHAEIWVNGQPVGEHYGLWTAFEFDISHAIHFGGENSLEVRITKPGNSPDGEYPYRKVLVGFIPYVSTTFGGLWKDVELVAHAPLAWENVRILPDWHSGRVEVSANLNNANGSPIAHLEIIDQDEKKVAETEVTFSEDGQFTTTLEILNPHAWEPGNPALYTLVLRAEIDGEMGAQTRRAFGFRALHRDGDRLLFNGKPAHLHGILHWGWLPDVLAPRFSDDFIRDEFRRVRDLGFNMIKLCLFVPSDNFFRIADEEGMFLWLELPMWWQLSNPHLIQQAPIEYRDIISAVHHHPSIVLYSLGCELEAHMADAEMLAELDRLVRENTSNALVCDNSGSGEAYKGFDFDFADFNDYHFYCDLHNFVPLMDHFRRDWRGARPWIFGEFCASDDYRDPARLVDGDGERLWWRDLVGVDGSVKRWAYREQEARINKLDLPFDHGQLVEISRRQTFAMRKYILEQARSRRGMGGYVVTGLRDTPITTSGIFDDFNQPKFDSQAFRSINNDAVLLLEQRRARKWINGDRPAPIDRFNHHGGEAVGFRIVLAHTSEIPPGETLHWTIRRPSGEIFEEGNAPVQIGEGGIPHEIARLEWTFPEVTAVEGWRLEVNLGHYAQNSWPLWVYPAAQTWKDHARLFDPAGCLSSFSELPRHDFSMAPDGVLISSVFTDEIQEYVRGGGQVILLQTGDGVLPARDTGFWQEALHLFYPHPVWEHFSHGGHVSEQFYHLATDYAFDIARFAEVLPDATNIQPLLRRLHSRHFTVRDYVVEMQIGQGRVIASTLRFEGGLGDQVRGIEANIAGGFLLNSMVGYLRR